MIPESQEVKGGTGEFYMKNIFKKLKADPRKAVGAIFFSVGVFCCLAAQLVLGVRVIKIGGVNRPASAVGWVDRVEDGEIDIAYVSGCYVYTLPGRRYVSTGFRVKQDDRVRVYGAPYDRGYPVVELLDENGKAVIIKVCIWMILGGALLCVLGARMLLRYKDLSKSLVESAGVMFLSLGILICLSALLLVGLRDMRIREIKNSAEELVCENGMVVLIYNGKMSVGVASTLPGTLYSEYVSTGFPIDQPDRVIVYYDKNNEERPMVIDLADQNGKSVIVKITPWMILAGVLLCVIGVKIWHERKYMDE